MNEPRLGKAGNRRSVFPMDFTSMASENPVENPIEVKVIRKTDGLFPALVQGEASFTQRLFLRPGCHGNEFEAEFL